MIYHVSEEVMKELDLRDRLMTESSTYTQEDEDIAEKQKRDWEELDDNNREGVTW